MHQNEFVAAHFNEHKEVIVKSFEALQEKIEVTGEIF